MNSRGPWQVWVRAAINLVYPGHCQICQVPLREDEQGVICSGCLARVKFIEPPCCRRCALPFSGEPRETFACGYCHGRPFHFAAAFAGCRAEGVVRQAIHGLKYHRHMYYLSHLESWLVAAARQWIDWTQVDAIVPVPLHPRKRRERGFNQAELLATRLGRVVGVPVLTRTVRRVKDTATQTRLDAEHRRQNLRDAFAVRRPGDVGGRRLVLVDDVFTTGVTLDSCARVLHVAGGTTITALTVARGV